MEKIYISKNKVIKWGIWGLLVLAGSIWWFCKPGRSEEAWMEETVPSIDEVTVEEITDSSEVVSEVPMIGVHVTGAVVEPDRVYYLPEGARVSDAIEAAGGANAEADLSQLNLAGYIKDGQRIYVPTVGEKIENIANTAGENQENLLTNINLASKIELLDLPGIGETYAERIIQHREENGPFETIEDIMKVKGIGESKFNDLKDKITVDE